MSGQATQPAMFDLSLVEDGNAIREYRVGATTICLDVRTDRVHIASVRTPQAHRGRGSARAAMQALLEQADAQGVLLELGASSLDKRTKTHLLVQFYASLGFEATGRSVNVLGHPLMVRRAQQHAEQLQDQQQDAQRASEEDVSSQEPAAGHQRFRG